MLVDPDMGEPLKWLSRLDHPVSAPPLSCACSGAAISVGSIAWPSDLEIVREDVSSTTSFSVWPSSDRLGRRVATVEMYPNPDFIREVNSGTSAFVGTGPRT